MNKILFSYFHIRFFFIFQVIDVIRRVECDHVNLYPFTNQKKKGERLVTCDRCRHH